MLRGILGHAFTSRSLRRCRVPHSARSYRDEWDTTNLNLQGVSSEAQRRIRRVPGAPFIAVLSR